MNIQTWLLSVVFGAWLRLPSRFCAEAGRVYVLTSVLSFDHEHKPTNLELYSLPGLTILDCDIDERSYTILYTESSTRSYLAPRKRIIYVGAKISCIPLPRFAIERRLFRPSNIQPTFILKIPFLILTYITSLVFSS